MPVVSIPLLTTWDFWIGLGLEQGLEQQRLLLCRLAVARFGSGTGQRLGQVLASVRDVDRLAEVGDWLLGSDTADELLAHANAVLGRRV